MPRKRKPLSEDDKALTELMEAKGKDVWGSPAGIAAVEKVKARYKEIEDLKDRWLMDSLNGKKWDENAFNDAFSAILSTYPVCTHWDYLAITQHAVMISDKGRRQMQRSFGNLTQRQSGTQSRVDAENAELERVYLDYMSRYPRATIKTFLHWYKDTDNAQTNNLEQRIKTIRKKHGLSRKRSA